jgi:transcriptional regulator with XRE-family HTH domain
MRSRDLVRIARERAGLTQEQLARRSGRPRETIARWETGTQEPSLAALRQIADAAGVELVLRLAERDTSLRDRVREQLALSPLERLVPLLPAGASRDVISALRWLATATTPCIVVGPVAAALQGGPQRPEAGSVDFVAADPVAMEMELRRGELVPLDVEDRWRDTDARAPWKLPDGGTLVLASKVPGTRDYGDLKRSARPIELGGDDTVWVAHPRDLVRMADASPREAERARVPALQALLDEAG